MGRYLWNIAFWGILRAQNGDFRAGPYLHTILVLLYINGINIFSLFVETFWYMVYISFREFMGRYLWNIAFWSILGDQIMDFQAIAPYDFGIIVYK